MAIFCYFFNILIFFLSLILIVFYDIYMTDDNIYDILYDNIYNILYIIYMYVII